MSLRYYIHSNIRIIKEATVKLHAEEMKSFVKELILNKWQLRRMLGDTEGRLEIIRNMATLGLCLDAVFQGIYAGHLLCLQI